MCFINLEQILNNSVVLTCKAVLIVSKPPLDDTMHF